MDNQLPAEIAEAIDRLTSASRKEGYALNSIGEAQAERNANSARLALDAVILKHIAERERSQTFPCPKCGVARSWLPACGQDECPLLGFDGKPLSRFADLGRAALSQASRGQTEEG